MPCCLTPAVDGGAGVVLLGGGVGAEGVASVTAAPFCSSFGVDEHPTSRPTTAHIIIHRFIFELLIGFPLINGLYYECVFLDYRLMSGPHAGSRTSPPVSLKRCFTRPSLDTEANIPRPLVSLA